MPLYRDPRDDDAQMAALAAQREEKRRARELARDEYVHDAHDVAVLSVVGVVVTLLGFAVAVGIVVMIVIAWDATDDDRFGWALGLAVAGVTVGYSYLFRKDADEVDL